MEKDFSGPTHAEMLRLYALTLASTTSFQNPDAGHTDLILDRAHAFAKFIADSDNEDNSV